MSFKIKFLSLVLILMCYSFTFCPKASAEVKTFTVSAKSFIGDNQTKNDARMLATLEAKRRALEQAGTYLESLTIVENFQLKKDEILAFTAGVAKTEIIEEKPILEGSSYGLEITAQVTVDTSILAERIKKLKEDNTLLEQNKQLLQRTKELEEELKEVYKKLDTLKNSNEIQQYKKTEVSNLEAKYSATEWNSKGNGMYDLGIYDKAIEYYTNAISLDPKYADAYYNRGVVYADKGDYDSAIADYNKAIKFDPNNAYFYIARGFTYKYKDNYDQAITDFIKAIQLDPNNVFAYLSRGIVYYDKGNYDKAIADYSKAIQLNPNHAIAYSARANAYIKKGNYDSAISDSTKAINLNPQDAYAYTGRGFAYKKKGNCTKANADYKKACSLGLSKACSYKCY